MSAPDDDISGLLTTDAGGREVVYRTEMDWPDPYDDQVAADEYERFLERGMP